jgi:hypothetical protein
MRQQSGQKVRLKNGAVAEVTDNLGDGIWLQLRNPESGEGEFVHCEEMPAIVEGAEAAAFAPWFFGNL